MGRSLILVLLTAFMADVSLAEIDPLEKFRELDGRQFTISEIDNAGLRDHLEVAKLQSRRHFLVKGPNAEVREVERFMETVALIALEEIGSEQPKNRRLAFEYFVQSWPYFPLYRLSTSDFVLAKTIEYWAQSILLGKLDVEAIFGVPTGSEDHGRLKRLSALWVRDLIVMELLKVDRLWDGMHLAEQLSVLGGLHRKFLLLVNRVEDESDEEIQLAATEALDAFFNEDAVYMLTDPRWPTFTVFYELFYEYADFVETSNLDFLSALVSVLEEKLGVHGMDMEKLATRILGEQIGKPRTPETLARKKRLENFRANVESQRCFRMLDPEN